MKIKYFHDNNPFIAISENIVENFRLLPESREKLRNSRVVTERKGQRHFRASVSRAYSNKCCITGETTPELLEAAHIQPYIDEDSNHIQNGLLLRVDFHKLYDNGLLTIDDNYRLHFSPQVKSETYRSLNGSRIYLP